MTSPAPRPRGARGAPAPQTQGPRLRLLTVDAPSVTPERFIERAARLFPNPQRVGHLWSPPRGMQSAGWGVARRFEVAPDESSFDELAARAAALQGELVGADDLPLRLHGGLAFDRSAGDDAGSAWADFGAGSFVLPQIGYQADGTDARLFAALGLEEMNEEREWLRRLERLANELAAGDVGAARVNGAGNGNGTGPARASGGPGSLPEILHGTDRPPASEWVERVALLRRDVADGLLDKVVAARTVELGLARPFGVDDLVSIVDRLRRHLPTCTGFAFLRGGAIFFGATPELLVCRRGRQMKTQALAGSMASDPDPGRRRELERQLLASSKDRLEHDLVVRYLVERLGQSCGGVVAPLPGSPVVRVLRNVLHLETPISAAVAETVEPPHVLELVDSLHPTPAVAGSPTSLALDAIRRTEERDRGWYAGPVGWFDGDGDGEFSVALRSCLAVGQSGLLYSGNGIVADSDPSHELTETNLKLSAILGAWT